MPVYSYDTSICAAATLWPRRSITSVCSIRPGVRIAFVQAPDNVRIELLERT